MPKAILEVDTIKTMRKHIEALQQENERLQVQNGAMRGALKQARATLQTLNNLGGLGYDKHKWIFEALAAIDKIGGREDESE